MKLVALQVAAALAVVATAVAAAGDAVRGAQLHEARCGACHAIDAHRVGPLHRGVVGRRAGAAADYEYSAALAASRIVWDDSTLDAWLADPAKLVPGSRMGYSVGDPRDRADLIAYLRGQN